MFRYKIVIEYDGTNFYGWQTQINGPSIQASIENAIFNFTKEKVRLYAAGRTDSGVHARGQVAHFDLSKNWETRTIINAINHFVRPNIVIVSADLMNQNFHARFSALKRSYRYIIVNRASPLAIDQNRAWHVKDDLSKIAMQEAANYLIGKHDFTSFRTILCQAKSPIKTIDKIDVTISGENIYFDLEAQSFLHHMVRNIIGTLRLIGCGKWEAIKMREILEAKNRVEAGPTAPACGLYFMKVIY